MPSIKGLSRLHFGRTKSSGSGDLPRAEDDSPEASALRGVQLFCESGSAEHQGEEVLHLPVIVEAAESSPAAASAAAHQIRKFLGKENYDKPSVQYNAVMLLRILAENPGQLFTRNIDSKFVHTVSSLLRHGTDPGLQQLLRETLDNFEVERHTDPGLQKLLEMWRLNRGFNMRSNYPMMLGGAPAVNFGNAGPRAPFGGVPSNRLPPPTELASRVEESKNSAKILQQLVQSTPPEEILNNDLVKEFADRCQAAQRSMQTFIACDSPAPDDDTLQTMIETSEQLSLSLSRHQRAILSARRTLGPAATATPPPERQAVQGITMSGALEGPPQRQPSTTPPLQGHPPLDPRPAPAQAAELPSEPSDATAPSSDPFADPAGSTSRGGGGLRQAAPEVRRKMVGYRY